MEVFLVFLGAVAGFALCWLAKDKIIVMVTGTDNLVKKLEAKAQALRAAIGS